MTMDSHACTYVCHAPGRTLHAISPRLRATLRLCATGFDPQVTGYRLQDPQLPGSQSLFSAGSKAWLEPKQQLCVSPDLAGGRAGQGDQEQ